MSSVNWHALHTAAASAKLSDDDEVYYGMPLVVESDYKQKVTKITVPGQWTGSVDQDGIKMTTDMTTSPGNTIIALQFTGSEKASVSTPLLSSSDPKVGCTVQIDYHG